MASPPMITADDHQALSSTARLTGRGSPLATTVNPLSVCRHLFMAAPSHASPHRPQCHRHHTNLAVASPTSSPTFIPMAAISNRRCPILTLPFLITCPWCNLLSLRIVHKGNLKFPSKNFFLLSMVENMNRDRTTSRPLSRAADHHHSWPPRSIGRVFTAVHQEQPRESPDRVNAFWRRSLAFFVHLTSKFPLVVMLLVMILYAIPACAVIVMVYVLITVVFALPSFLILYYAYRVWIGSSEKSSL